MRIPEGVFVCAADYAEAPRLVDDAGTFLVGFVLLVVTVVVDFNDELQRGEHEVREESAAVLPAGELRTIRDAQGRDGVLERVLRRGALVQAPPADGHDVHLST